MKDKNAEAETPKEGEGLIITDSAQAVTSLSQIVADGVAAIKKKYGTIKLTKTDDKAGIDLAKEGHATVKELASKVEKRRVELVAPALEFQRAVNDAAKGLISDLKEVQNHLKGQLDHIDDVKKQEKAEAAAQAAAAYNKKTAALFALGVQYNGNVYSIGSVIIEPDQIRDSDTEGFAAILQKAEAEKARIDEIAEAEELERENTRKREAAIRAKEAELNYKAREIDLKALGAVLDGKQWRLGAVAATVKQVGEETDSSWATILEAMRGEKTRQDAAAEKSALDTRINRLTSAGAVLDGDVVTFEGGFEYACTDLAPSQMTDLEFADIVTLCQREVNAAATFKARIQRLVSRGAKHENGVVKLGTLSFTDEVIKAAQEGAFSAIYDQVEAERDRLIADREAKRKVVLGEKGFTYSDGTECWVLGNLTINANQVKNSNTEVWRGILASIETEIARIAEASKPVEKASTPAADNRIYRTVDPKSDADQKEAWRDGYKTCANVVMDAFKSIKSRTEFSAFIEGLVNVPQPPDFL